MDVFINSLKLSRTGLARQAVVRKVTAVKVHELYKTITIPAEPTPSELPNVFMCKSLFISFSIERKLWM